MRSRYLGGLRLFYHARKSSSASLFIRTSTRCLTQKYFYGYSELTKAIGQAVNQLRLSGNMSGNGQNGAQSKKGRRRSKSPKSPRKREGEDSFTKIKPTTVVLHCISRNQPSVKIRTDSKANF